MIKWEPNGTETFQHFWDGIKNKNTLMYLLYYYDEDEIGWYERLLICSDVKSDIDRKEQELLNSGIRQKNLLRYNSTPVKGDFMKEEFRFPQIKADELLKKPWSKPNELKK